MAKIHTDTVIFRAALTLAILWLVGSVALAFWTNGYVSESQRIFEERHVPECLASFAADSRFAGHEHESLEATCSAGVWVNYSAWDRFWGGAPVLLAIKMFLGPALLLLAAAAYGPRLALTASGFCRYRSWLLGGRAR